MTLESPPRLTVIALAWHEAKHLAACFASLKLLTNTSDCETLILLDAERDPETERVARQIADHVEVSEFVNFSAQRNKALALATGEWVFFVDADERGTPSLAKEISEAIVRDDYAAYRVPRRNILFGHEVRHTGWWPDYQIRLLRRNNA